MSKTHPKFSPQSLKFLKKAGRQKREDWLDRNRDEYEAVLLEPMKYLAQRLKAELAGEAIGYNFPQKGLARMKRSARSVAEHGGGPFRDWMHYSAARPRESRFENNPNLFFFLNPEDKKDPVLLAGGLYMPSSRQMRGMREAIAHDASAFERLFATKEFKRSFPKGFSDEKISSRIPRGFDAHHPKIDWIRLQAFFVWKPYSKREFVSKDFASLVVSDCRQILRMNTIIDQALSGKLALISRETSSQSKGLTVDLSDRLEEIRGPVRESDF